MSGIWWKTWCVVLAGGEGSRLAPLTHALCGRPIPKQFAVLTGNESLLQSTLRRMTGVIAPERTVVVVAEEYAGLAAAQLEQYAGVTIVTQPRNLGTALGILLGLAHVRARAPGARVVITPADHYIPNPDPLYRQLARALCHGPNAITLAGVTADSAETEYGWIVPGAAIAEDLQEVQCFVEKPSAARATELLAAGGLWNTFVFASSVPRLWRLFEDALPVPTHELWRCIKSGDPARLRAAYAQLAPANFSQDVLERCPELRVTTVQNSGWTDFGSVERVLHSAAARPDVLQAGARLLASVASRPPPPQASGVAA
ncbi:MAG TPA: sugar phosphate nucleotidyltransferase [Polyangiaceae bacterium]